MATNITINPTPQTTVRAVQHKAAKASVPAPASKPAATQPKADIVDLSKNAKALLEKQNADTAPQVSSAKTQGRK